MYGSDTIKTFTWRTTIVDKHIISHISGLTAVYDSSIVDVTAFGFIVTRILKVHPVTRVILYYLFIEYIFS